jgi:hypothetical protein
MIEAIFGGPEGLLMDLRRSRNSPCFSELKIVNSASSFVGLTDRVDAVLRFSNRL